MLKLQDQSMTKAPAHRRLGLSYVDLLLGDLARPDFSRKRHRTRRRLIAAAAEVLGSCGLERLRVADIALAADLSAGAFYVYFTDRTDVAKQVLRQFADYLYTSEPPEAVAGPDQLRRRISAHLGLAQANGGLLRALGQAALAIPDMADYAGRRRADWILKTTAASMAAEEIVQQPGHTQVLDVLMRGAIDRFASPRSAETSGGALADGIAAAWLATITSPADLGRYRGARTKDVASKRATPASQNAAAWCALV